MAAAISASAVVVVEELEPEKSAALKRKRIDLVEAVEGVEHEKAAAAEGVEREKATAMEVVEQEKAAASSDSDSEDSDDDMDDELRCYNEQIDKSDGFDIDFVISKRFWTAIYPIHLLEDGHQKYDGMVDTSAKFAIKNYNEQHQDHEKLELIKVVRANVMMVAGYFFFITLKAKNIATSEEKTYQTQVDYKFGHEEDFEVPIFRLCPVQVNSLISARKGTRLDDKK